MSNVLVAMSGGVDSSVAAARMVGDGHEVIGVTMKMWAGPNGEAPTSGCCTVSDAEDARRVAAVLDIPYYVFDYTDHFSEGVIDRFVGDYLSGRTPNPCVECNRTVKFAALLDHAAELECDLVATGHYARTWQHAGRWHLGRGVDTAKDQSYVLSMLSQHHLERVRFPVGSLTKPQTRALAGELGLRTADKTESMDICFVRGGDYREFLAEAAPKAFEPGPLVDTDGAQLGVHEGVVGFTIGQRRGLGVAVGEPRYVTGIDAATSTVTLGGRQELEVTGVSVVDLTSVSGSGFDGEVLVQFRAHGAAVPASLDGEEVSFSTPQEAVSPGQTITFYDEDEVLGGGVIASTHRG
ncbi:tRNA 2-thiouridine(34) synthase MnmA [soil metagenome]